MLGPRCTSAARDLSINAVFRVDQGDLGKGVVGFEANVSDKLRGIFILCWCCPGLRFHLPVDETQSKTNCYQQDCDQNRDKISGFETAFHLLTSLKNGPVVYQRCG
jgi:hypothetical protein